MYVSNDKLFAYSLLYSNSGHFPNRVFKKSDFGAQTSDTRETNDRRHKSVQVITSPMTSFNQLRMMEERAVPKNVTAQVGLAVYLHCIVEPVGDKMVGKDTIPSVKIRCVTNAA